MIPPRCNCGKILAHIEVPYEKQLNLIENNDKLSLMDKEIHKSKLLNELGITRICCRTKVMTTPIDIIKYIK